MFNLTLTSLSSDLSALPLRSACRAPAELPYFPQDFPESAWTLLGVCLEEHRYVSSLRHPCLRVASALPKTTLVGAFYCRFCVVFAFLTTQR